MRKFVVALGLLLAAAPFSAKSGHACESASAVYGGTDVRPGLYVLDDAILAGIMSTSDAAMWFTSYAEEGIAEAQYNLAVLYERGDGIPKDDAKAFELYRRAAAQKFAEAKFNLGVMHHMGWGTPQNHAEAAKWYRLAAGHGIPDAKFNLGLLYHQGKGVPRDETEALRWCRLAAGK